jgi:hypothetical protein
VLLLTATFGSQNIYDARTIEKTARKFLYRHHAGQGHTLLDQDCSIVSSRRAPSSDFSIELFINYEDESQNVLYG